jgi:DNA mismatch repair ATPase MutS
MVNNHFCLFLYIYIFFSKFKKACFVEEKNEKVVFLYKLKPGPCPASFGINVARVTGIP